MNQGESTRKSVPTIGVAQVDYDHNAEYESIAPSNDRPGSFTTRNQSEYFSALSGSTLHTITPLDYGRNTRTSSGRQLFRVTGYRWIILVLFSGMILTGSVVSVGFSSLVNQMTLGFGVDQGWVVVLLIIPSTVYIPMSFLSANLYNKMRTHHVVYLAAVLQILGCWTRSLAFILDNSFVPIILGTVIYVLSIPMLLSAISLIANLWFSDD